MIEVEKKFQPTEEQLKNLLKDAVFVEEKTLHDIYYDYPDYGLIKKDIKLRSRDGNFELKIGSVRDDFEKVSSNIEIINIKEIEKYFDLDTDLSEFISKNLEPFIEFDTYRKKYKKGSFVIDIDKTDFGYDAVEIELLVENGNEAKEAQDKIINLAKEYNFEVKKVKAKRTEYLKKFKPEIYEEIYGYGK